MTRSTGGQGVCPGIVFIRFSTATVGEGFMKFARDGFNYIRNLFSQEIKGSRLCSQSS